MNPIAIWCKFKDYGDWCYAYRIPEESEFVEGFEFEYINFIGNYPKKDIIKPYLTIDFDIIPFSWEKRIVTKRVDYEVIWSIIPVMYGRSHSLPLNHLKSYLEAGYIRVKKANERLQVNNNQNIQMKLFCYKIEDGQWILERNPETKEITKYTHDLEVKNKLKYIVVEAETSKDGEELIYQNNRIDIPNNKNDHSLIKLNGVEAFTIGIGKELSTNLQCSPSEILILGNANNRVGEILPSLPKKIKPNLKAFSNLTTKLMNVCKTIKRTIVKVEPNERYLGKEQGWKPIVKPTCHQPEKSPNALVCIATKDRKEFKRVTRKDASEIISTQLADEKEWEYISKQEYRKLLEPLAGRSFTPRLGEIGYTPQEKFSPNKSSSKVAVCKRKSKHHQQGVKKPKNYNNYEVSFHKDYKDGQAEFVYAVTAKTEEKALSRAKKKLHAESPEAEYHRKHGMANLPLFKPVVKLLSESSTNSPLKGESVYKRVILPKVIDLPIRKDKKGNIIPWTKKVTRLTTEEERAKGKAMFEIVDEEIKTYTKYEVSYHKQSSPFKKTEKWKHPIKDNRNLTIKK